MAEPFVRWVGGSQKTLPELLSRLPADAARLRYVDPFLGGGALFWALEPRRAVLSDACAPLIAAWRALRDVDGLIDVLMAIQKSRSGATLPVWYRQVVEWLYLEGTSVERGACFIALNRSCFNGLWRVNSTGHFNAALDPASASRDLVRADLLRRCAAVLAAADAVIEARGWEATIAEAGSGDLVYADPPYDAEADEGAQPGLLGGPAPVQGHRYTAAGWTRADLVRLADALAVARDRGAYVLSTNNPTTFAVQLFEARGFRCDVVQTARSVSRDGAGRAAVGELIAVGAP